MEIKKNNPSLPNIQVHWNCPKSVLRLCKDVTKGFVVSSGKQYLYENVRLSHYKGLEGALFILKTGKSAVQGTISSNMCNSSLSSSIYTLTNISHTHRLIRRSSALTLFGYIYDVQICLINKWPLLFHWL